MSGRTSPGGGGIPISQKDGVEHKSGFTLAKENETHCLGHQISPGKPDEDRYRIDALADEGKRVCDRSCAINLCEIIITFFPDHRLERRGKLATVVE